MKKFVNHLVDRLVWPLLPRLTSKVLVAALFAVTAASTTTAGLLREPYNRVVPASIGLVSAGLLFMMHRSQDRKRKAKDAINSAIIQEAIREYTDRYNRPKTNS